MVHWDSSAHKHCSTVTSEIRKKQKQSIAPVQKLLLSMKMYKFSFYLGTCIYIFGGLFIFLIKLFIYMTTRRKRGGKPGQNF